MKKLKADILVIALVIIAALLFFFLPELVNNQKAEGRVEILLDGELLYDYPLSKDRMITVFGEEEGYNLVLISEGNAKVTDADCPDQLCMKQRSISRNGQSIICLPHRLVVQIKSQEESGIDALAN